MKKIFFLIFVLSFNSLVLFSQDKPPAWKLKLPHRLYINEVCIRPAEKGYPNWIELWNHTDKAINMKNWSIKTAGTFFEIKDNFIVNSGKLALILLYNGNKKNEEFEKTIPENCKIIRFFNRETFPYKYISDNVMERGAECVRNGIVLNNQENKIISTTFWGAEYDILKVDAIKSQDNKTYALYSLIEKILIYPSCAMLLYSVDRFTLLNCGTSTPGSFYPKTVSRPVVEPSCERPSLPSYYYFADPEGSKNGPTGMGPKAGNLYLPVERAGINLDLDRKNGWDEIICGIAYDEKFKYPVLKSPSGIRFNWKDFYFFKRFTFEDYLYLIGKTLYCRVGRENKNGKTIWSETKSLTIPNLEISSVDYGGLLVSDISKTNNKINYHDDIPKVQKIKSLVKKLKNVVDALGIFDLMKPEGEGRLMYIKFRNNLDGIWLRFSLYGIKCLPCAKSREAEAKQLKKVGDFSFLKGINNLALDLGGTDIPQIGGLRLILEKLPKKPTGLRLAACNLPNISPLTELPLEELDISRNKSIPNLKPLSGMPLKKLNIQSIGIGTVDLSPLVACKYLEEIILSPGKCRNLEKLRKIPTLKSINNQSVKKFFSKQ